MIRNYFKIAIRNLWKNKSSSIINITGLTAGLTCCLLMVLYIQHELSYDKFQEKGDRIVRVIMEYSFGNGERIKGNFTSTKVFPAFKKNFPEVEDGVRMNMVKGLVKSGENIFNEDKFLYADSTFFNLFPSFRLVKGNPAKVLAAPNMVVLSESAAIKYFGSEDPIGKTLLIGAKQESYMVTGIAADCPANSQIRFNCLASFSSLGPAQEETYWNANYTTYLLLKDKQSIAGLQKKIGPFMKAEMSKDPGVYLNYMLEPFTRVHLYSAYDGFEPNSSISYVYITGGIALLILVIACFTYINLSTARSLERAREVGIRKVSGAFQNQVFWQFIGESAMVTCVSLLISFGLAALLLPSFNQLADRNLLFSQLMNPAVLTSSLVIAVLISFLAGSYPAIILSKFQPVKVLKGSFRNTGSGTWLRKSLIVFQFVISAFLVIATFVMQSQLRYIQTKQLGYDREHVMVLTIDQKIVDKIDLFKTELKTNPNILAVSKAYNTPVNIVGGYTMRNAKMNSGEAISVRANPVDDEYIKANSLKIIAGADLNTQDLKDALTEDESKAYYHYVINESAARALGWSAEKAIGQKLFLGDDRPGEVKAVIRDFNFQSLHNPVEPLVLFPGGWGNSLIVKTTGRNLTGTISFLEKKWKELAPHRPFEYRFMNEDFDNLYRSELRTGNVLSIFSGIAILLACLGLFGLSAYSVQQRTKEIGVRKVLGASVFRIAVLLASQFVKLVAIAFLIAIPFAWLAAYKWLEDFAYRVSISWAIFLFTGLAVTLIAVLTVSFQAIRAAIANPVRSLRSE
jgi:putative ABC transport system permease protein